MNNKIQRSKFDFSTIQPHRVLLCFFIIIVVLFVLFLTWEFYITKHWLVFGESAPILETRDWLFLIGLLAGIAGWVCSSYVTLRNSTKQHTFNIYVQSRLSSAYVETMKRVNVRFFAIGCVSGPIPFDVFSDPENAEIMHDIGIVLNYFEFIAVGILNGDLDESTLKKIMRGIIDNICSKASLYIDFVRDPKNGVGGARSFEHLLWLNERWKTS